MDSFKKIFIIDDDINIRNSLKRLFREFIPEAKVIERESGENIVAITKRVKPQLILLDVKMPEKNGLQILRSLKRCDDRKIVNIPVIMLTGIGNKELVFKTQAMGAADYITKPFNEKVIIKKIKQYLRS